MHKTELEARIAFIDEEIERLQALRESYRAMVELAVAAVYGVGVEEYRKEVDRIASL